MARLYPDRYDILGISAGLYEAYQQLLIDRNYLDYDEMIAGALRVMADPTAKKLWQQQVHAVFEDEAQDSSPLQERLLRQLAGIPDAPELQPNLIRVGDPNQAINSTFTPADPRYFRDFCQECSELIDVNSSSRLEKMEQAGRSTQMIMSTANFVLDWGNNWLKPPANIDEKNTIQTTESVFWLQTIRPVSAGDAQPNPSPQDGGGRAAPA